MYSIACPRCARVGSLRNPIPAGTRVRCPGCGERFVAGPDGSPGEIIDLDDLGPGPTGRSAYDVASPTPPAWSASPVAPASAPGSTDDDFAPPLQVITKSGPRAGAVPGVLPPEPWYYRVLSGIGQSIFVLALVGEGLMVLAAIALVVASIAFSRQNEFGATGIGIGFGLGLVYVLWGVVLFTPAVILSLALRLAVDVARNIRMIRYL